MKAKNVWLSLLLLLIAAAANAAPIQKGTSILAIQITEGTADLISPGSLGYVSAYDHSELGVQVQYWRLVHDDCAFNLSGGIGFFKETDEPGSTASPGGEDFKYTQSSWQVRVGMDRVAHLSDRIHLFAGPGLQVWSGKAKFSGGPFPAGPEVETGKTLRFAAQGRIGLHVKMGESAGVFAQLGHYFGYATAKDETDEDAKAKWWPSGHDGAAGLAFTF